MECFSAIPYMKPYEHVRFNKGYQVYFCRISLQEIHYWMLVSVVVVFVCEQNNITSLILSKMQLEKHYNAFLYKENYLYYDI